MPATVGAKVSVWTGSNNLIGLAIVNAGGSPQAWALNFQDTIPSNLAAISLAGKTDFVWRLQKDTTKLLFSLEIWNVDGSGYVAQTIPILTLHTGAAGGMTIGDGTLAAGTLAFLRWYSTLLPLQSKPPFGPSGGDLGDWEFNNNGNDSSGNKHSFSFSPSPNYVTAPTYPPACIMPPQTTFRAGTPALLDGTFSFPLDGGSTLTYVWQQNSGPTSMQLSDHATGQISLNGLIFGSYVMELTVTDGSNQSTTCSTKYGAVATDANGSVIISNPVHAQILGPILAAPNNPWPGYEQQGKYFANLMIQKIAGASPYQFQYVDYWNQPKTGTVDVSVGSTTVTGHGTTFLSTFCGGSAGACPLVNGTPPFIVVWNPIGGSVYPGTVTGRYLGTVVSCSSDTSCTIARAYPSDTYFLPGSGLSYAYSDQGQGIGGIGGWEYGPAPGNYYDNVEALYAQYYRTGIDDYLVAARTLADSWFSYPFINKGINYISNFSMGNGITLPYRSLAMTGLFMRNADSPPFDMWPGLRLMVGYLINDNGQSIPECNKIGPNITTCGPGDIREQSYADIFVTLDALFDPNAAQAAASTAALSKEMQNRWTPSQQPAGEWIFLPGGVCSSWNSSVTATATNGSAAITLSGSISGNGNCIFPAGPYNVSPNFTQPQVFWVTATGTASPTANSQGDSNWYYVTQVDATHFQLIDVNGNPVNYTGTGGSGLGWEANFLEGLGNQPFMVGIQNRAFYLMSIALANADPVSAAHAAQFTLDNANWMATTGLNSTNKGVYYGRVFVTCEPPSAALSACDSGILGDRELNGEGLNSATIAYLLHPTSQVTQVFGDLMMNAMFSCPGDSRSDGTCIVSDQAPNGYMYTGSGMQKWFGYYWGVGGNWSWASARLGGLTPPIPRVVQVSLDFQTASQAVLTVLRPDGTSSQATCTSSPCPVTIDARQGDHLLSIKYLDPLNRVLRAAQQTVVKAR